jgi:phosphoribosylformylglycinamidine (FGAM) synthase-like enzyme
MRPVLKSRKGIAVSQAVNPIYSKIDTYHMTTATMDEAVRKVLAVGADPDHLAGVDNFCWPTIEYDPVQNPDGKYKAAQLVRSNQALRDTCLQYGIPLLSGKDSMYIDGNLKGPFRRTAKGIGIAHAAVYGFQRHGRYYQIRYHGCQISGRSRLCAGGNPK